MLTAFLKYWQDWLYSYLIGEKPLHNQQDGSPKHTLYAQYYPTQVKC